MIIGTQAAGAMLAPAGSGWELFVVEAMEL